jgi:hypothetical protein
MNISIFCLIIFSDESIPDSTIRPSEEDDDVDTPSRTNNHDIAVEYQNGSNNDGYKRYENVDDWRMSFLDNIQAGLPSVRMRKKKSSNLRMEQRRTVRHQDKVYFRVSKPPEMPQPLHERRRQLHRKKTIRENIGGFASSVRSFVSPASQGLASSHF